MNDFQRVWWEQARSDHAVLVMLRHQGVAPCHQLHYLQMVTEKISKAFLWRSSIPKRSHVSFTMFFRFLLGERNSQRQLLITRAFLFPRFIDFRSYARTALPLVHDIERLAPALANDGPNPEYPWPQNAPQFVPATFDFDVWHQLTDSGRGRQLMNVIHAAVDNFPVYA